MCQSKPVRPFTVALDMDDTLYDLHGPWLAWIKTVHHIDYPVTSYWQPELRNFFAFLALKGTFLSLPLMPGAREAITAVHRAGVRQILVSTCVESQTGAWEKQQVVARDFPVLARNVIVTSGAKDCIAADVLVDDAPHNIEAFPGITIRIPYLYNASTPANYVMADWKQYPFIVSDILEMMEGVD